MISMSVQLQFLIPPLLQTAINSCMKSSPSLMRLRSKLWSSYD